MYAEARREKAEGRRTGRGCCCWKPWQANGFFRRGLKSEAQGRKMAGEPRSQSESPPGTSWTWPAATGHSPRAATFTGCVDILDLVIRMMMKLWVRNSVPHPSKHTSESAQYLSLGCSVQGPFRQGCPQTRPLGVLLQEQLARPCPP